MAKQLTLQLGPVRLDEQEVETFKKSNGEDGFLHKLTSWAGYFLNQYLHGGIMLTSQDLEKIAKNTGEEIQSADDLVAIVESAKKRKGGQYTVEIELDPVWYPAVEEVAEWQGCQPEDVFNEIVNTVVGNGSVYDWVPPEFIPVSADGLQQLKQLLGTGHVNEAVLIESLKKGDLSPVEA